MKILSLSGFVPEQICDTVRFTGFAGNQPISHYCGYAADFISQVKSDTDIDGAVFPKSCDSSRSISSYLEDSEKFLFTFGVPIKRDAAAIDYFAAQIEDYQKAVENHYDILIDDIPDRVLLVNKRNKIIGKLYDEVSNGLAYSSYLESIHKMLALPLKDQLAVTAEDKKVSGGKKVYIVGSFMTNEKIVEQIESSGMCVVGDNLTESKRIFTAPEVSLDGDIYHNIAESMLSRIPSPTQNCFEDNLRRDLDEIKRKNVQGVIFITQKYCEPYDYMWSVYKKALDEQGIKALQLKLSDSKDDRNIEFAVDAFDDTL